MKTRTFISKRLNAMLATFALAILATASTLAADDEFSRKGKTEVYAAGLYLSGNHFDGYGGGLGMGYHFTDYISLNGEGTAGRLEVGPFDGALYTGMVNVEYNILKKRFTPFLTVGGGALGYDIGRGLLRGSGVNGIFGGGAGLRWDVTDRFFMKAEYRALDFFNAARDSGLVHSVAFGLGFKF